MKPGMYHIDFSITAIRVCDIVSTNRVKASNSFTSTHVLITVMFWIIDTSSIKQETNIYHDITLLAILLLINHIILAIFIIAHSAIMNTIFTHLSIHQLCPTLLDVVPNLYDFINHVIKSTKNITQSNANANTSIPIYDKDVGMENITNIFTFSRYVSSFIPCM